MNTSQGIHRGLAGRFGLLPAAAGGLLLLLGLADVQAQPPVAAEAREIEGKVDRLTTAPRGEIDGAVLDNGKWLHWPPHMQDRFANVLREGDRVRATGRTETGPEGDEHFEVERVVNARTNVSVENPDFAFGPPPPAGPRGRGRRGPPPPPAFGSDRRAPIGARVGSSEVQGNVTRLTTAPRGEIDGAMLDNGTWLHWPPHMQDRFADFINAGDKVRATGRTETGPAGDTHFEIEKVTNIRTNASAENPDYAFGPPLPGGPRGRGRRLPPPLAADRRPAFVDARRGDATEVRGTVQRLTTAPRGEVDGAILDDGTWLHWPPHLEERFVNVVRQGDRVRATGQTETGPAGDTHFEVQSVTNLRTDVRADNPDSAFGPPAPLSVQPRVVPGDTAQRDQRLRELEEQISRLQREIELLRRDK